MGQTKRARAIKARLRNKNQQFTVQKMSTVHNDPDEPDEVADEAENWTQLDLTPFDKSIFEAHDTRIETLEGEVLECEKRWRDDFHNTSKRGCGTSRTTYFRKQKAGKNLRKSAAICQDLRTFFTIELVEEQVYEEDLIEQAMNENQDEGDVDNIEEIEINNGGRKWQRYLMADLSNAIDRLSEGDALITRNEKDNKNNPASKWKNIAALSILRYLQRLRDDDLQRRII